MEVPGVVTNITRFGAFVDIGVKQDGLVHVSEISHTYISDPNEALKLNQHVFVKVVNVDTVRKRIALSIKQAQPLPAKKQSSVKPFNPGKFDPAKLTSSKQVTEPGMNDALAALKQKFGN
ncbi:MAG: S1 RNA-binding domain-containing protein [Ferruginibacter sp.]